MPYIYDTGTHKIIIPRGDTATIHFNINGGGITDGDAVIFRIRDRTKNTWVLTKKSLVQDGKATIRLSSSDTRVLLSSRQYGWTVGVVSGMDVDENGEFIANEDTDNVLTAFNQLMLFEVTQSGILGPEG